MTRRRSGRQARRDLRRPHGGQLRGPSAVRARFRRPARFEADVFDCEVEGELPADLSGGFYRLQCDFAYPPPHNEWRTGFNGDGHVSLFRFAEGRVHYRSRYVKTERLMAERAAGRRLFGVYRNRSTDDPAVNALNRSAANTNLIWHAGRLLVLKEDALPYQIDPLTLDTLGAWDCEGALTSETFSAHPKIDPVSGEMIAYGYQARGDLSADVAFYVMTPDGRIERELWLKAPYAGIMHDIALTREHILLPVIPMVATEARLQAGEPMWDWDPSYPTMVGVIPRDGEARDVRWFEGPPRMTLHFLNAESRGQEIRMELPVSDGPGAPSEIRRWRFDLSSGETRFGEERVAAANGPLARIDDRFVSPNRYVFAGHRDDAPTATEGARGANCYQRIDLHSGEVRTFWAGESLTLQECCFAPRPGGAEAEGWLLGVASNHAEMASELVVVDAQALEAGAVARVKLPFRLRSGTHGLWIGEAELPPGAMIAT